MSYTMSAQVIGDKELKAAFENAPKVVARELGNAIEKTAREVQRKAVQYAPHMYGMLQQSIITKGPVVTQKNVFATVGTDKLYARYQEEGTGIHGPKGQMIRPKTARAMPIVGRGGHVLGWTRKSQGVRPKRYMKRAREDALPLMTNYIKDALSKILHFLAKG